MSLGIFVEGRSDRDTIRILLQKLGQREVHVRFAESDEMLDTDAMLPHIQALRRDQRRLTRILIFRDSECTDTNVTFARTRKPEKSLNAQIRKPPINYVIVDHSIEGWLGCDQLAVRSVVGGGRQMSLLKNPETECRPARLLGKVFRANGKDFRKTTHNIKIAEIANTDTITQKSPTFARLVGLLRNP